jgi:hypothetical protein
MVEETSLAFPIAHVLLDKARVLESLPDLVPADFGIDAPVHLDDIRPAVVIVVDKGTTPGYILIVDLDSHANVTSLNVPSPLL